MVAHIWLLILVNILLVVWWILKVLKIWRWVVMEKRLAEVVQRVTCLVMVVWGRVLM